MNTGQSYPVQAKVPPVEVKDKRKAREELYKAVRGAHEVLVSATTVFPFTLFPDTVALDHEKFTITHRVFWRMAEVMSIRVEDVLNVTAQVGPIFGSIKISTRFFDPHKPYVVNYFWRKDAIRVKTIMQGYIIAIQKQIDCNALTNSELITILEELGQGTDDSTI